MRLSLIFIAYTGHCVIFSGKRITARQVRMCLYANDRIQQKMQGTCFVFSSLALLLQTITSKVMQIKLKLAFLSKAFILAEKKDKLRNVIQLEGFHLLIFQIEHSLRNREFHY